MAWVCAPGGRTHLAPVAAVTHVSLCSARCRIYDVVVGTGLEAEQGRRIVVHVSEHRCSLRLLGGVAAATCATAAAACRLRFFSSPSHPAHSLTPSGKA